MRDRDRQRALEETLAALRKVLDLHAKAVARLDEYQGGYPSSQLTSDIHKARGSGDPVGEQVAARNLNGTKFRVDPFERQRQIIDESVPLLLVSARRLERICVAATALANRERVEPECVPCAKACGFRVAVFANERCEWHYKFFRDWGTDAHPELTRLHHQGRRIDRAKIRELHPGVEA